VIYEQQMKIYALELRGWDTAAAKYRLDQLLETPRSRE
jgi:hypothetical protein